MTQASLIVKQLMVKLRGQTMREPGPADTPIPYWSYCPVCSGLDMSSPGQQCKALPELDCPGILRQAFVEDFPDTIPDFVTSEPLNVKEILLKSIRDYQQRERPAAPPAPDKEVRP